MTGRAGPGRAGYWIGGGLIVAAVLVAIVAAVGGVVRFGERLDDLARVAVPGEARVDLDEGGHTVYFEVVGLGSAETVPVPPLDVTVTGPDGVALPLSPYGGRFTYSLNDRSGVAIATVEVPADGTYDVVVRVGGEPSTVGTRANLAVGQGVGRSLVGGVVLALGVFFGGIGAGITALVVTAVRRSRARTAAVGPLPGYGWSPGPPGPSWAPQSTPPGPPGSWAPPPQPPGQPGSWAPPPKPPGPPGSWTPPPGPPDPPGSAQR